METAEIVILGAGLAGLTVAYKLEMEGIPYQLLEARDRIGGRVHTIETSTGATIEMGATWFADKHIHLMDLIRRLQVPYQEQYTGSRILYDYANPGRMTQVFDLPTDNDPQYLFTKGTGSLLDALYQNLNGSRIHLGQRVEKLIFEPERVTLVVNGHEIYAQKVISTLPPNLFLNNVTTVPELPVTLSVVAEKTHTWMGESIKVGLEYPSDFWRGHKIGTILSQFGPAQELHDHQHEGGKGYVLKGFINPAHHLEGRDSRRDKVFEQMRQYFDQEATTPEYFEKDWQDDPLTFHPYSSEVMPHQYNGHPAFRESYFNGALHLAGSETARAFPGYLDGAVERGMSVAQTIIEERATLNFS